MSVQPTPTPKVEAVGLESRIVKYDLRKMLAEATEEFDTAINTRELVDQDSIANLFDLKGKSNARN